MDALKVCQSIVYEIIEQVERRGNTTGLILRERKEQEWNFRNVELECWIQETRKREIEDIELAYSLAEGADHSGKT